VVTGDLWNAGTNANVYLALCGENGDTGFRQLFRARTSQQKFQAGMVRIQQQLEIFVLFILLVF